MRRRASQSVGMAKTNVKISGVLEDIGLERQRRLLGVLKPDPHAFFLWNRAAAVLVNNAERERLAHAFRFAKGVKYRHDGLTSDIYFAHPLRVAALAILLPQVKKVEMGVLGILHNILEVSDVSSDELAGAFGTVISSQVTALTVNRDLQWDRAYKTRYYNDLMQCRLASRVVKIVDKLDNLFLIGLNGDGSVRSRYLEEIEEFVLPMTVTSLPGITAYMAALVKDCRITGAMAWPVASKEKSRESQS
jgi:hypothetical protein